MLYIQLLSFFIIICYNYTYISYLLNAYIFQIIITSCINNNYWLDVSDYNAYIFGSTIYCCHYIYHNTVLKKIINNIYNFLFFLNLGIEMFVNKYLFKNEIKFMNIETYNVIQNNLKLIKYIEDKKLDVNEDELTNLLIISKFKINEFLINNKN